jgi:hypothetical protein
MDLEKLDAEERRRLGDELLILARWTTGAQEPERELQAVQTKARAILTGLLPSAEQPASEHAEPVLSVPDALGRDDARRLTWQLQTLVERLKRLVDPRRALYEVRHQAREILNELVSPEKPEVPVSGPANVEEIVVSFQWQREGDRVGEMILSTELRSGALMRLRDAIVAMRKKFRLRRCAAQPTVDQPSCGKFFVPSKRQIYCVMHRDTMREMRRKRNRAVKRRLAKAKARGSA